MSSAATERRTAHKIATYARVYLTINGTLLAVSLAFHLALTTAHPWLGRALRKEKDSYDKAYEFEYYAVYVALIFTLKNLVISALLSAQTSPKPWISPRKCEIPLVQFVYQALKFSCIEAIVYFLCYSADTAAPLHLRDQLFTLKFFILRSFIFEVIFDFFHYWIHRFVHSNSLLYRYTHKQHHQYLKPTIWTTYNEGIAENVATNAIPMLVSMYLVQYVLGWHVSHLEFCCLSVYKAFIEISGHCGKDLGSSSSFPQCVWLPRILGISLRVNDHDCHHLKGTVNFSKRFILWDKVFGTYVRLGNKSSVYIKNFIS